MLCLLVVVGVGLLLTLLNVRRTRQDVERRMSLVAGADGKTPASRAAETMALRESGWRQVLGRQLRDLCAVGLARTWGMNAGVLTLILAGSGGAGVAWLVLQSGLHLSNWISFAVTAAAFVLTPRFWLKHQQNDADKKFMEVFPDTIDMVIRMLRAGVPVTTAVRVVGEEAPSPVSEVFTVLADQMAIGISFDDALTTAGQRIGLADFRFFAIAISLQRATGGNLATTLDILSDIIRKRRAMRLKAKATTGEVRMSAYVLGAIPFVVIGGLLIVSPAYLAPMIADPRGKVIIAVSVVSLLVGFGIIRQMMRSVTRAA
jgi:tight adherence protein B